MGRLLGLELNNFKSYKGTVSIGFGDSNFTSIIGPNGSGKSNLMDAISFVLGVKSLHLRSHMLVDLIYRGTLSEEESATPESELPDSEDHPTSAYVKAFYSPSNQATDCVELTRTITRSQDSAYKIDGKIVSYKKYSDFLESQNILIKARNFLVFQGDVEQVASQKPQDLTTLFEQVSGSLQHKQQYDKLREELEKARSATSELLQSRKRAHAGLRSFKEGANRDEEYRKYLEERSSAQQQFIVWQLYHLQARKEAMCEELEQSQVEIRELEARLNAEEGLLKKHQTSLAKTQTIIAKQKSRLSARVKIKESLASSLLPIKSSKEGVLRRIQASESKIDTLQKDVDRQEALVKQYNHQLKVVSKAKAAFETEIVEASRKSGDYKLSEADLKIYEELREEFLSSGGSSLEDKLLLEKNNREELVDEIGLYSQKLNESVIKISEELGIQKESLESELAQLTVELNEKNSEVTSLVKKLKELQSRAESNSNKEYEMNYKLKETLTKLDDMNATQKETVKERKLRENVSTLRRLFPGVKGLVHDLCHPKKERYAVAVSTVLGMNFDSVIVENLSVAQQCVSFLKKQRSGIVSFIPLDTISVNKVSMISADIKGCTLAIDAIDYEPQLERAFQYVCSDAIICDSLGIAKNLKWNQGIKSKLVSLEGAVVHKAGLMTGGASSTSENRWNKEEYQNLMSLKDMLLNEISALSTSSRLDLEKIRSYENALSLLSADVTDLKTRVTHSKRMLHEKQVEIDYQRELAEEEFKPKIKSLEGKVSTHDEKITQLDSQKAELQNSIYAEFSKRVGFTPAEYESHSGKVIRKQSEDLRKLQMQIASIEKKLEFENERLKATQERQQKAQVDVEKAKIKMETITTEESNVLQEITEEESSIKKEEERLEQSQVEVDKNSLGLNSIEEAIQELTEALNLCKSKNTAVSENIEKAMLEKTNILKNCKMLNIKLPQGSSSLDVISLDKVDDEALNAADEVVVDYSGLSRKLRQNGDDATGEEFKRSIEELDELLAVLQPNSKAAGRYEDAKIKYDEIFKETEKCKATEKRLNDEFSSVRKLRKEAFDQAFDHVSETIEGVYRELTRDPHSTAALAGGNASLTLEDEDEPYLAGIRYHATPPTKRFKDMEYLSGGEKTIAALALLFAINSYQPSPFFILDEVDAALDITNVERIATYIRRQARADLQFIVISLINTMFEKSQSLVGVFRQQSQNSSKALTLNLENYAD
ncbi:LANO_0B02454g1_1 [Lachancea nothofagi CBS 11611]|uniref:Structural maintenance of chromosomes protein n=1 Tax=Lachancea nothofagi CBS 11611 TaxID=1266666 RepID=A0A1G4IW62_9SACH|nr:LANO_0B02454g1_1 [Lachancea nothofagi CBS 11611]